MGMILILSCTSVFFNVDAFLCGATSRRQRRDVITSSRFKQSPLGLSSRSTTIVSTLSMTENENSNVSNNVDSNIGLEQINGDKVTTTSATINQGNNDIQEVVGNFEKREKEEENRLPSVEYMMMAMGTSPRRLFTGTLAASGIALAGNFLGLTSFILEKLPEDVVEKTQLDTYYPRGDFKRFSTPNYTLLLPKNWAADQALELQKAQARAKSLEYSMTSSSSSISSRNIPDAAFGPVGRFNERGISSSDTNVSILVTPVNKNNFSLRQTMGTPQEAAEFLLTKSIAPEGSGRVATLLSAKERPEDGIYQLEYQIDRSSNTKRMAPILRAISIIAERNKDTLITMTVVAPQPDWENDPLYAAQLRKMADSFRVKP